MYGHTQWGTVMNALHLEIVPVQLLQEYMPFLLRTKDDYYCESSSPTTACPSNAFLASDPLWDGSGCIAANNCCTNPGMPWFYRLFA